MGEARQGYKTIQCGVLVKDSNGTPRRIYRMYTNFFKGEMEVFSVLPQKHEAERSDNNPSDNEIYYRGSDLGRKLNVPSNSFSMFLRRKKGVIKGVCQAAEFLDKAIGAHGLKYGCYFVSESACYKIEEIVCQNPSLQRKGPVRGRFTPPHDSLKYCLDPESFSSASGNAFCRQYSDIARPSRAYQSHAQYSTFQHWPQHYTRPLSCEYESFQFAPGYCSQANQEMSRGVQYSNQPLQIPYDIVVLGLNMRKDQFS